MNILLTGASGFLGKRIVSELNTFNIETIGRAPTNIIKWDMLGGVPAIKKNYDIVIHTAGKAHLVPKTESDCRAFFDINVIGTENFLKGFEKTGYLPKSFVFISSVAVYGLNTGYLVTENSPLLANDPYGLSKIQAEQIVLNWCEQNKVICTILRLPLLAGEDPPGNFKAMIAGIKKGYYFNIAGGKAKKSIVLAKDIPKIILIAAKLGGIYNLTDLYHPNFAELSYLIAKQLGKPKPLNIPMWLATLMAKVGDLLGSKAPINSSKLIKITSDLTFDDSKAKHLLGWKPTSVLDGFKIT